MVNTIKGRADIKKNGLTALVTSLSTLTTVVFAEWFFLYADWRAGNNCAAFQPAPHTASRYTAFDHRWEGQLRLEKDDKSLVLMHQCLIGFLRIGLPMAYF